MVNRLLVALGICACVISLSTNPIHAQSDAKKTAEATQEKPVDAAEQKLAEASEEKPAEAPKEAAEQEAQPEFDLSSEFLLPAYTKAWVSVPNPSALEDKLNQTQFGLLAQDPAIKPFIESFEKQAKEWFDSQNVRLGLTIDDLEKIESGEICLAGVLPDLQGQAPVVGSHGLVLIVDVTKTIKEAKELQVKINKEQVTRGAVAQDLKINGIDVKKFTLNNPKRFRKSPTNLQAIVNGRMLVCDNETIFRDVLRRLAAPTKIQKAQTLSAQKSFVAVMDRADLDGNDADIRWFVDPFGYAQLAQALEKEERVNRPQSDSWVDILQSQGFGAFKGVGGRIAVATGKHEILHSTFTYAPKDTSIPNAKRMFDLFDFSGKSIAPPAWVPADCTGQLTANWQMTKALSSIGHLFDAFMGEPGDWDRILHDLKIDVDTPLDVKKLVGLIDNQFTVVSAVERPIDETSERLVVGVPIKGEPDYVFESLKKAFKGEELKLGGIKVLKLDSAQEDDEFEEDQFDFPDEEGFDEEEEEEERFELFATKFVSVHKGYLLVANDKDYLKKLLAKQENQLGKEQDYVQVQEAIAELTDAEKICWGQFGRSDKALEANYETLRKGEMGKSQTVVARIINQIFVKRAEEQANLDGKDFDPDQVRKQKLDGSKLPEDYQKSIAPYLGPSGWVMEAEETGWRITGVLLKKKGGTEIVRKVDEDKAQR